MKPPCRGIDRFLVVALVILAVLASGCDAGGADDFLDALVDNAEEPDGGEVENPERITGPSTVLVDDASRFTVEPDQGGTRVDWRIDYPNGSPYSRPEEAGSVLTYAFLDAGEFVVFSTPVG